MALIDNSEINHGTLQHSETLTVRKVTYNDIYPIVDPVLNLSGVTGAPHWCLGAITDPVPKSELLWFSCGAGDLNDD